MTVEDRLTASGHAAVPAGLAARRDLPPDGSLAPDGRLAAAGGLAADGAQAAPAGLDALADLLTAGQVAILSGAGLSTESGIPDYRGPTGLASRAGPPMTYEDFAGSAAARQRYWARSHVGWRHIVAARPNAGHRAVAELGRRGRLTGIITQNVDGLHQAAGARDVTELHGSLSRVRCLDCGQLTARLDLDRRLRAANPEWAVRTSTGGPGASGTGASGPVVKPDGDADLPEHLIRAFRVADCARCGGVLKPDVVFFGENVPRLRVERCFGLVERSAALLVLGSSLTVMSGFRFVRHAARTGVRVAIVNQGSTRGDADAEIAVQAPLGDTLTDLLARMR